MKSNVNVLLKTSKARRSAKYYYCCCYYSIISKSFLVATLMYSRVIDFFPLFLSRVPYRPFPLSEWYPNIVLYLWAECHPNCLSFALNFDFLNDFIIFVGLASL